MSTVELDTMHPPAASERTAELYPPPATAPKKAKKSLGARAFSLLFMLACGVLGYTVARMFSAIIQAHPLLALCGFVFSLWPNVILHEAGHALGGLARGMRAIAFGVGPFRFERGGGGWHMRRTKGIRGISGFAILIPSQGREITRADLAWFLSGGPLANLVTGAIGLGVLVIGETDRSVGEAVLLGVSTSACLLGLANLIPFRSHGWRSDGRNLIDLAWGRPDAWLQMRIIQIMGISASGVRPRDWPEVLVPSVPSTTQIDPMLSISGDLLGLARAMDQGDATVAETRALGVVSRFAGLPAMAQAHIALNIAGYVAVMRRDPDLLGAWLSLCAGGLTDLSAFHDWLRAEHAALTGRTDEAREAIARAEANVDRIYDTASVILLREYLARLQARLSAGNVAIAG